MIKKKDNSKANEHRYEFQYFGTRQLIDKSMHHLNTKQTPDTKQEVIIILKL